MLGLPRRTSWAARGVPGDPLRFVYFADVHARTEWRTPEAMRKAARAINELDPDLVIAGGDLITDGFQAASYEAVAPRWDAYMAMHEAMDAPVQPAIGNHDLVAAVPEDGSPPSAEPRQVFLEKMGLASTYRSFDRNGCHVVVLDATQVTGGAMPYVGTVWPSQLEWLKEDLAGVDDDTPVIAVTHIPLLTGFYQATRGAAEPAPPNRVIVNNHEVLEVFEGKNLVLVLQGHLHVDEMLRWRDTTFITGGAVCGKWWRGPYHGTQEGFGLVSMHADRVDWEYVNYGWEAERPADR